MIANIKTNQVSLYLLYHKLSSDVFFVFLFFETESHYITPSGLELTMETRLTSRLS